MIEHKSSFYYLYFRIEFGNILSPVIRWHDYDFRNDLGRKYERLPDLYRNIFEYITQI